MCVFELWIRRRGVGPAPHIQADIFDINGMDLSCIKDLAYGRALH